MVTNGQLEVGQTQSNTILVVSAQLNLPFESHTIPTVQYHTVNFNLFCQHFYLDVFEKIEIEVK